MTDTRAIDSYLDELRKHLGPIALTDREEIVREIQAHIRDSAELGTPLVEVLARLGPARELAAQYRDGLLIRRASRSLSPLTLLRGSARMATRGVAGTIVFFAGLLGYTAGAGMVLSALLKPFFPANVGVWLNQSRTVTEGLTSSTTASTPHEILGIWAIPVFLTLGSLTLLATTMLIRSVLRESQRVQFHLQP